eukprot:jgi/Botrbrau1/19093/Bobra.0077s0007.1
MLYSLAIYMYDFYNEMQTGLHPAWLPVSLNNGRHQVACLVRFTTKCVTDVKVSRELHTGLFLLNSHIMVYIRTVFKVGKPRGIVGSAVSSLKYVIFAQDYYDVRAADDLLEVGTEEPTPSGRVLPPSEPEPRRSRVALPF